MIRLMSGFSVNSLTFALMTCSFLLGAFDPHSSHAEPISSASPDEAKSLSIPDTADMIVSGGGGHGEWVYIMGPLHDPSQQKLKFMLPPGKDGKGVAFECERSSGRAELAFIMPGVQFKVGQSQDVALQIGPVTEFLKMTVKSVPPEGRPPIFYAEGKSIPDILSAMGHVPTSLFDAKLSFGLQKKYASFPIPRPAEVPKTTGLLCESWMKSAK